MHSHCFPGRRMAGLAIIAACLSIASPAWATNVIFKTTLGDIEIELFDEEKPKTVANFLAYVNDGDYNDTFIHRSVPNFVIQGGAYTFINNVVGAVATNPAVKNEPGISNTRGTIAMAKISGNPDSATSQWFINLKDNSAELDNSNGGFTVFGRVVGNGMQVVDAIAALPVYNAGASFQELPMINYSGSGNPKRENLVLVDAINPDNFRMNAGMNDAWYDPMTGGQGFFVTVFPDIEQVFLAWFTFDTERPDASVIANLGDAGHRWLTAFGPYTGGTAELQVEITQGGIFDSPEPAPGQTIDGTITLDFSDCDNGSVSYNIPSINRQGVVPIQRIALDNLALCEELAYVNAP